MKKAMIASVLAILAASAFAQSFASLSGDYVFALQSEPGRDSKGRIVTDRTASHSAVFGYDLFLGDTF